MKHKALLIFVLAWVIIAGMTFYIFYPQSPAKVFKLQTQTTAKVTNSPTRFNNTHAYLSPTIDPNTPSTGSISFNDLLFSGKNQKCTFQEAGVEQTIYMNKNNIRDDFTFGNDTKKAVHLLTDGEFAYIWTETSTNGISTPESKASNVNTIMQNAGISDFDINTKKLYLCTFWTPTNTATIFAAPGNINFSIYGK
jgi:hypothetical protein